MKSDANYTADADDFFVFCKSLNAATLKTVLREAKMMHFNAGSTLCRQNGPSDTFFVVNEGLAEVVITGKDGSEPTVIRKLNKGDFFGEIGLLTNAKRDSTVRVPESVDLLLFTRSSFERLIKTVPEMLLFLCASMARRLHEATTQLAVINHINDLSGDLSNFDLATTFQAISGSGQTGVLNVQEDGHGTIGEFFFEKGLLRAGRWRSLRGPEALWQLFQEDFKGSFYFLGGDILEKREGEEVRGSTTELLMTALHKRDELSELREKISNPQRFITRKTAMMDCHDGELSACAEAIWQALIQQPMNVLQLVKEVPFCEYHVYKTVLQLFESGQLIYTEPKFFDLVKAGAKAAAV